MKLRFNKAGYISLVGDDWCVQFLVKYKYWRWCWKQTEWWGATETLCIAAGPLFMYMCERKDDTLPFPTLFAKSVTPAEVAAELLKQEQAKLDTPANTDSY